LKYEYTVEKVNYEDYAAGRVLYTQAGMTSFPVRLASEIFQRCAALLPQKQLRVYDPCCGSAYLLTTLGFLHGTQLKALWASDIQLQATTLARKNLALLTKAGLAQRQAEIETMLRDYGKTSHADALTSVERLRQQLSQHTIDMHVWLADAMQPPLKNACVDVLLTDVPYGDVVSWNGVMGESAVYQLLEAHYPLLARPSVVAIISDKKQKASHPNYDRILHETLGKRRITLLQPRF
jgi:23S rRNA (guanine2535-N1)-methyltransferase